MTDLKISEFADGNAVEITDEIAANRAGVNTKVFVGSIAARDEEEFLQISDLPDSVVMSVVAGDNITVSGSTGDVTITGATPGETNTMSNVGASGVGIYKQKTGVDFELKKLVAGSNVTITGGTNDITITGASASGETNTMSNVGASGVGIYKQKTGVDFELKKLVAGSNVTITGGTSDITITGGASGEVNTASNVGSGEGIYKTKSGVDFKLKSLVAGANITLSGGTDDITIVGGAGGGSGSIDTASNIGDSSIGGGVFNSVSGSDIQLNRIVAGSNITVSGGDEDGNITLTGGTPGETNTMSNVGASGVGIYKQKTGVDFELKKLVAGSNVTITGGTSDITITGGGMNWATPLNSDVLPDVSDSYDIGSSSYRISDIFNSRLDVSNSNTASIAAKIGQNGGHASATTGATDANSLPYDHASINVGLSVKGIDTSNTGSSNVNYTSQIVCDKQSGTTDAAALGVSALANGNTVDVWGATIYASVAPSKSGVGLTGLEVGLRDWNTGTNGANKSGVALAIVGMGYNSHQSAVQIQVNTDTIPSPTGTANGKFKYGVNFNSNPSNPITDALVRSDTGCTSTYGMWLTGAHTVGFEHGGSGASAGFRCTGGGTSAYKVTSSGYTYGIDFRGINFTGGYVLSHDKIDIYNTGVVNYKYSLTATAGSLLGYLPIAVNSTAARVPVYAV